MLKRISTALLLIPFIVSLLYWGSLPLLSTVGILLFIALGYEWSQLVPLHDPMHLVIALILLLFSLSFAYHAFDLYLTINLLSWPIILFLLTHFPLSKKYLPNSVVYGTGLMMLPVAALSTSLIYQYGQHWLLYLLLIAWCSDTSAYLVGKTYGKHPLIFHVSPGKTIEGLIGSLILTSGLIIAGFFYWQPQYPGLYFAQGIATYMMTILGDLWISLLKRRVGYKDTGNCLPGHGGLLDRLDSFIAAAPVFYILLH